MRWKSKGELRRHRPQGWEGGRGGKTDKKGNTLICKI